jgi:Mn-dependent DtxR family transcriptional regulator
MTRRNLDKELKRDELLRYIWLYSLEHNGVTPSYMQIASEFDLKFSTVRGHIYELANEGKLRLEDRQIIVEDSEWIPPEYADL